MIYSFIPGDIEYNFINDIIKKPFDVIIYNKLFTVTNVHYLWLFDAYYYSNIIYRHTLYILYLSLYYYYHLNCFNISEITNYVIFEQIITVVN